MKRLLVIVIALLALGLGTTAADAAGEDPAARPGSEDALATTYFRLLEKNTRFQESTWDEQAGTYALDGRYFVGTLGNAILLRFGSYDPQVAGVPRELLREHTLRSIAYAASHDKLVDPDGTWGASVYFDSTYEAYVVAAAHLLWSDLDAQTREDVDTIVRRQADNIAGLGLRDDPLSPGWSTNGLAGAYQGDTKMEEMGARTMPLAAALAYLPGDPSAPDWREWLDRWTTNMNGLPVSDESNPTPVDGTAISDWNSAQNIYDTFFVENHGSWAPIYQQSAGAYPGRNAVQYLIAGLPVPRALAMLPNDDELWQTMGQLGMDSGVPEDFMVADRHHLYGRNLVPIVYRSMVLGDRDAARAEQMLADHLDPYVDYPPSGRLTKFSGQPTYEPEARAELAMSYLLHYWRGDLAGDVRPVSEQDYFAHFSYARDFGPAPGLVAQQTPRALSAAVTKPGFVKFDFLPQHDDWLFDVSASAPSLLPSTAGVDAHATHVYRRARDGFEGTATVIRRGGAYAGFTTLPTGDVVYATTGTGSGEGALRVQNLDMPGVPGLDGDRTFTAADGSTTLRGSGSGLGDGGVDDVRFAPATGRYVRFLGVQPATQFGYSLMDFEVHSGSGPDLAQGRPTTASSFDAVAPPGPFPPQAATDGDPATRWAVSRAERTRPDSWLTVDLGAARTFDAVRLSFDPAYATAYRIQVSDDGQSWHDAASVPSAATFHGSWLNVDSRAGFVIHGSDNPIGVTPTSATLSDGPAAGAAHMVVQGFPAQSPQETARLAAAPQPSGGPDALRSALTGGYLSLFDLGGAAIEGAELTVPQPRATVLYAGEQRTRAGATEYRVALDGGEAAVQPPRFRLRPRGAERAVPAGLDVDVLDSHHVRIENDGDDRVAQLTLTSVATGERAQVTVPRGKAADVAFGRGMLTPVADLARSRITYPASPLPAGMSDPDLAVDGDPGTAWEPGAGGRRMVVNLGGRHALTGVTLRWRAGPVPAATVATSDDGRSWSPAGAAPADGPGTQRVALDRAARYVAVTVGGWGSGEARLADLAVEGSDAEIAGNGDGGLDQVDFAPTQARYVRMLGVRPATQYGYSLYELEAYAPGGGANLAEGGVATASSYADDSPTVGGPFPPRLATDGDATTRWAVARAERTRADSWLAVDLGAERSVSQLRLRWESAYGAAYRIQVSDDGQSWRDVASVP